MKCALFHRFFIDMTSRTLIVAHCDVRSVGIALCYDMGVGNPPSPFEGVLASGCMTTFSASVRICAASVCGDEVME